MASPSLHHPPMPALNPPRAALIAAGLLVLGLATQLALPWAVPLPEPAAVRGRRAAGPPPQAMPVPAQPVIAQRNLFAPSRAADGGAAAAPTLAGGVAVALDPFGGATLIGTARSRVYAAAVVRGGDGVTRTLRPGARLGGWRLAAVGGDRALFTRGGRRRVLLVGAVPFAIATPTIGDQDPEDD